MQATDCAGGALAGVSVYLTFAGSGEASANTSNCDTPFPFLSSSAVRCTTDASGDVPVTYFSSGPSVPNGGSDTITAAPDSVGTGAVTTSYTYATLDHIGLTPTPLAPTGSLGVGGAVQVVATPYDSSNNPIPGMTIYLSFSGSGELDSFKTDQCGGSLIGKTPMVCRSGDPGDLTPGANQDPNVKLTYFSSSPSVPNGGTDTITAAVDSVGTGAVTTLYTYATLDHIGLTPTPLAPTGSLGVGGGVQVVATPYDSSNNPIPGLAIYLSFSHAAGSSGELDSFATGQCGADLIFNTPVVCRSGDPGNQTPGANQDPNVKLQYFASGPSVPNGGTDTITAAADSGGTGAVSTSYTYATIDHIGLSPTPLAPDGSLSVGGGVQLVATPYDSSNNPIPGVPIYLSFSDAAGSSGELDSFATDQCAASLIPATPVVCLSGDKSNGTPGANQDPNVKLTYFSSAPSVPDGGTDTVTAAVDASGTKAVTTSYTYGRATVLTYSGSTSGDYHDNAGLAATLVTKTGSQPVPNVPVVFTLGPSQTCTGTTNSSGVASCSIAPNGTAGDYTLGASFAGGGGYLSSSDSKTFTVTKEETTTSFTGPTATLAGSSSATLSAKLVEDGANDNDGDTGSPGTSPAETVTLSLGSQSCTGTTQSDGTVSCTLSSVSSALGPQTAGASFAGDSYYKASSASTTVIVFAFPARGAFVLGNRTVAGAGPATLVTWWSSVWYARNSLSGGSAPSAFKGFAGVVATLPTSTPVSNCTGTWTSNGGNSPPPPATVPSYMGVIVASKATKAPGNTIKGNFGGIVVVQTSPGYAPNLMSPGTGKIVATVCP